MRRKMKYVIGTSIPTEEIVRRFKDEDGEMFVEIRGMTDVLFRVTDGDRVYYKIEKSKMKGEELTLVEDYTLLRPKSITFHDAPTGDKQVDQVVWEDEETELDTLLGKYLDRKNAKESPKEKIGFDEGEKIPKHLRNLCKKNDHGGYTLRHDKFLYILDKKYRVEIKTPDSTQKYELEPKVKLDSTELTEYENSDDIITLTDPLTESDTEIEFDLDTMKETETKIETEIELETGDIVPPRLRTKCEAEIGHGFSNRLSIGNYIYHLNSHFKVIQKMKISYLDEENKNIVAPEPQKELSIEEIITTVVKIFDTILDTYDVDANYFKEAVLGAENREILMLTHHGDLEGLNDDTREAASQGKIVKLGEKERGFNLFKASLIHELYIKSTVAGRGENMNYFLSHFAAVQPDGTIEELQDNLSFEDQKKMVNFFKERAHIYTDKTEIIRRVHLNIRSSVFQLYEELVSSEKNIRFNALLISRLYEQTTRLDRGDGVTMIRLTRDLLDFPNISH